MCNIEKLITINQANVPLEVLKALLLSGGTKNEDTKQETRVSKQSVPQGSCTLTNPRGGLSLREIKLERGHHLVL